MNESMNARWLRWTLTAIAVFLGVIAVELSVWAGPIEPRAMAQLPDSAAQRKQLLESQDRGNVLLDSILQHLRTQTVKVKVVGTDKDSKAESKEAPRAVKK